MVAQRQSETHPHFGPHLFGAPIGKIHPCFGAAATLGLTLSKIYKYIKMLQTDGQAAHQEAFGLSLRINWVASLTRRPETCLIHKEV